jgi:hypothetical protein
MSGDLDSLGSDDGQTPKISKIRISVRVALATADTPGIIFPVIVQTAGTWADTIDLAVSKTVTELLADSINDVFGVQVFQGNVGRMLPDGSYGHEFTIEVPGNILQILNKEAETERLQNLHFGLVGLAQTSTDVMNIRMVAEYHYELVRKSVILR